MVKLDNDFVNFRLACEALRMSRSERFRDYLPLLEVRYDVEKRENGSFVINSGDFGKVDFFPKCNKVLIRKDNRWLKPGLRWILNNLLN